ncbi:MAG: hypothetical protein QOH21_68 [Acidobacteriota bacterium]|jgi:hypothetical protein|nr:hypothetical protein [Acidobacteriota bacterium]
MPRAIAIVLERDYAARLEKLAFHTPVWIVDTPQNHAAAEEAWLRMTEWPQISVTVFRPLPAEPARADWAAFLEQLLLHHPSADALHVIGSALTLPARAAMTHSGFTELEESPDGFRARRP